MCRSVDVIVPVCEDGVMTATTGTYGSTLDQLGLLVTSGEAKPGDVLRTDELEERLSVSRTVIREAVRVLESMGMVESKRKVGVIVSPTDRWSAFDPRLIHWRLEGPDRVAQLQSMIELRMGFEPAAAALAARRATPAECGILTGSVMDMAVQGRAGDLRAYLDADVRFHTTLLNATRNPMFSALHKVVAEVLDGRTRHDLMPTTPNPEAVRLHADVAQAIQIGDSAAAEAAMRQILIEAGTALHEAP